MVEANHNMSKQRQRAEKHPFLAETRNIGNMGCCAACGSLARCTSRAPHNGFYVPQDWSIRSIDDEDGQPFLVYTCDRCMALSVDGPSARDFYDRNNLRWAPSSKAWETIPIDPPVQVPAVTNEEKSMTTNGAAIEKKTFKEKAVIQANEMGGAAVLGLKLAAVDEVGEMFVDILREFSKNSPMMEAILADDNLREIFKASTAALVKTAAIQSPGLVPQAELVSRACDLQITASVETLAKPQMKNFRKAMGKLALVGQRMAEIEGGATAEDENEEEAAASSAKATARAR